MDFADYPCSLCELDDCIWDPQFDRIPEGESCLSWDFSQIAKVICLEKSRFWDLSWGCFSALGTWVCAPQATPLLKVCHRAECLSWGCTDVDHREWLKPLHLRWRQVRIYCCIPPCPLALIPIVDGSCGLVGNTSSRSMYIFQPLAVWLGSWTLLLYEISGICGAKIRNICVMSGVWGAAAMQLVLEGLISEWWQAWPMVRKGPGGLTYRKICFLVVRNA